MMERSPCLSCTRVTDPDKCDNKNCGPWRRWFLVRWEAIHSYPRRVMENPRPQMVGVPLGGRHYAAPNEAVKYLSEDPCGRCRSTRDLCRTPCRVRRIWEGARKEAGL